MKKLLLILLLVVTSYSYSQQYVIIDNNNYLVIKVKSTNQIKYYKPKLRTIITIINGKVNISYKNYTYFRNKVPSDFEDENGVVYTEATLNEYLSKETAKSKAGGSAETTQPVFEINKVNSTLVSNNSGWFFVGTKNSSIKSINFKVGDRRSDHTHRRSATNVLIPSTLAYGGNGWVVQDNIFGGSRISKSFVFNGATYKFWIATKKVVGGVMINFTDSTAGSWNTYGAIFDLKITFE